MKFFKYGCATAGTSIFLFTCFIIIIMYHCTRTLGTRARVKGNTNNFHNLPFTERKFSTVFNKNISSTLSEPQYTTYNHTFVVKDLHTFKNEQNEWDFKLLSRQLEDVFGLFLYKNNKEITPFSTRAIIKLFTDAFEKCDLNKDNVLDLNEFKYCVKSSKYFKIFHLDSIRQPQFMINLLKENEKWTNINDTDSLVNRIFYLFDEYGNNYLNFYDYMMVRLTSFAWRKCGNIGFFIDEVNFECAIEIVAKMKTLNRNSARSLYKFGLEISNFQSTRYLDLATFILLGLECRLYSKINTKEDNDMTRSELTLALEASILPIRYDKNIVDIFFKRLSNKENNRHDINSDLDLYTFIFYDVFLRLFQIERKGRDKYCIEYGDFVHILNDFIFPKKIIEEFYYIPKINLTETDYEMVTQVKLNKYYSESDFLLRFAERNTNNRGNMADEPAQENPASPAGNTTTFTTITVSNMTITSSKSGAIQFKSLKDKLEWINNNTQAYAENSYYYILNNKLYLSFDYSYATSIIYHLMDFPQHNCVGFEEFLHFIEVIYLFKQFDTYKNGKLTAGNLYDQYKTYSGYPKVSWKVSEYVNKFKQINSNTVFNPFYTYAIFRSEELVRQFVKQDFYNILINEMDLNLVLERMNIRHFPDGLLRQCIKGFDDTNLNMKVPQYDWQCALSRAYEVTLSYLETYINRRIVKKQKIKLVNTEFKNVPMLKRKI